MSDTTDTVSIENSYKKRAKRWKLIITGLIVALIITVIVSLNIGFAPISFSEIMPILGSRIPGINGLISPDAFLPVNQSIILDIRLPRILSALIIGAALSVSGVLFQGIFKNPMADPSILGVSSGASVGAGIAILWIAGLTVIGFSIVPIFAFITGLLTIFLVYTISRVGSRVPEMTLLLTGTVVSMFNYALFEIMQIISPSTKLPSLVSWLIGGVTNIGWTAWWSVLPFIAVGILVSYVFGRDLNMMALGEDTAQHLGVNTERTKKILLAVSTMMTAAAVCISGLIGFVGLMVPHMARLIIGPDHRILIPASVIVGAILLIACDALTRVVTADKLPVGAITALLGAPFFIFLLRRSIRSHRM